MYHDSDVVVDILKSKATPRKSETPIYLHVENCRHDVELLSSQDRARVRKDQSSDMMDENLERAEGKLSLIACASKRWKSDTVNTEYGIRNTEYGLRPSSSK